MPVAAAAALAAGGVVFADSAFAATAPTVTLTAPATLSNDGQAQPATITINNSAAGSSDLANTAIEVDITGPATLNCADISLTGAASFTFTGTGGHCVARITGYGQPSGTASGSVANFTESVSLTQPGLTGTATSVVRLIQQSGGADVATIATSNTATTAIVNVSAPSFNAAPPAAIVHQNYSYKFANPGFPGATYTVSRSYTDSNGVVHTDATYDSCSGTTTCDLGSDGTNGGRFVFTPATGLITGHGYDINAVNHTRYYTYTLTANNVVGSPTASNVVSPSFQLPILFSDVAPNSTFGTPIYTLGEQIVYSEQCGSGFGSCSDTSGPVISGYGDGTFRPAATVTRQAFVHYVAQVLNENHSYTVPTGPCNSVFGTSNSFNDVSNNSVFCAEVNTLVTLGIVNGYADGGFHPSAPVSRQAISAFLYRLDETLKGVNAETGGDASCNGSSAFPDVSLTNQFCGDIKWMVANNIATGYADGGFHPLAGASRQAVASFLYKLEIEAGLITAP